MPKRDYPDFHVDDLPCTRCVRPRLGDDVTAIFPPSDEFNMQHPEEEIVFYDDEGEADDFTDHYDHYEDQEENTFFEAPFTPIPAPTLPKPIPTPTNPEYGGKPPEPPENVNVYPPEPAPIGIVCQPNNQNPTTCGCTQAPPEKTCHYIKGTVREITRNAPLRKHRNTCRIIIECNHND